MRYTQNVIYKNGKYEEQLSALCPRGDSRDSYLLKIQGVTVSPYYDRRVTNTEAFKMYEH